MSDPRIKTHFICPGCGWAGKRRAKWGDCPDCEYQATNGLMTLEQMMALGDDLDEDHWTDVRMGPFLRRVAELLGMEGGG